ncbi:DUF1906 domain-containing protein [Streptacidiphilus sp. EB103A]|uniref:DUF1906 domain-containing protein n=1 Tax=Streptacidiphilus sp. EB103A TaxID=3156275 RepID=UPI0035190DB9
MSSVVLSAMLSLGCLASVCTGAVADPGTQDAGLQQRGLDAQIQSLAPIQLSDLEAVAMPDLTAQDLAAPDLASLSDDAVMAARLAAPDAALASAPDAVRNRRVFRGQAFDTCVAPGLGALRTWKRSSPYGALGVYIGGRNRACAQPQLSADWTRSATSMGWSLLPLYVGLQAPCLNSGSSATMNPGNAAGQGTAEGRDAVNRARALAIRPGSPLYLDMESYARGSDSCTLTVLQYTAAWSHAVRAAGYLSGFYSSSDSGVADLSWAVGRRRVPELPDIVWYARWDGRNDTSGYGALGSGQWGSHQRVHQFVGNTSECHGGVRIHIDRDAVDGPVAVVR